MTRSGSHADHAEKARQRRSNWTRIYVRGVLVCFAGTLCTALLEFAMLSQTDTPSETPPTIVLAVWGRVALTHACSVLPITIIALLPISMVLARRGIRSFDGWQAGFVALIGGALVVYGDIAQYEHMRIGPWRVTSWWALVLVALVAVVVFGLVRWIAKGKIRVWYRRV
ncbi:MAG: hypothetical protein ACYSUQ_14340, partial [Planctomycetota bacterium]